MLHGRSFKNIEVILAVVSIVFIGGGVYLIVTNSQQKPAHAQLADTVEVRAIVLPNPKASVEAAKPTVAYSELPVVTLGDIKIDGQVTNFPVTCSFTFENADGQSVTVTRVEKKVNACSYDVNRSLELQNAKVIQGELGYIGSVLGVGEVKIKASLAGKTITTNSIPYQIKPRANNFAPKLNAQNMDLEPGQDQPNDSSGLNYRLIISLATASGLIIFIFANLLNYFKIPK